MTVPVVHVITMLELGGAQQNTLHTVASLDRKRFSPQLICGVGGLLDEQARELADVPVHFVPQLVRPIRPWKDMAAENAVRDLLRTLANDGPVIVHTHSSKAGIIGRRAARRAGAGPVVHSIHGFGHDAIASPVVRRIALTAERRVAASTDAFVSVARFHVDQGRALGLFGDARVEVIRSGIDIDAFARADELASSARSELGLPPAAPVVGMIACLKPQKAPLDFADVAAGVLRRHPDAHFFVAGDGILRADLERRCRDLGLGERMRLLGWRNDIPALLGALDVLVLTSRWEGLPRVCPQAMAAGRPVVAPRVDGIPEAIVDGRNGLLFATGDIEAATNAVAHLLDDADLRASMGHAGRLAVEQFGQQRMVSEQEALYESLLAAR